MAAVAHLAGPGRRAGAGGRVRDPHPPLLLTSQWHFPVLQAASIAPGPITAGIVSPFSGRLSARFGTRSTVVAGAVLFAAAGAWPLASAEDGPAYAAVVLPSMLL
jgi:MFS family permease